MNRSYPRRGLALSISALAVASCVAPPPQIASEAAVAATLSVPVNVRFRSTGSAPDEPPPGRTPADNETLLGIADALRRAIETSPALQAALARVRIARAVAEQARVLPNPALDFIVRLGSHPPQLEGFLAQPLLALLQRPRKAQAADDRLRAAAADALTVALDEAAGLRRCYLDVQMLEYSIAALQERHDSARRRVSLVDSQLRHGEASSLEHNLAITARLRIEQEISAATLRRRSLRLQLARRIGEPSSAAKWRLDPWRAPRNTLDSEADWIRRALECRPELHSIRWQLAALGDDRALAEWQAWQDIAVGASVQRAPTWVGGPAVTLPLPIFDRGDTAVRSLTAKQSELRHRLTQRARQAIEQVREAFSSVESLQAQLHRTRDSLVPLLEARLQRARAAERIGEGAALATLEAEVELGKARAAAVSRQYEIAKAQLRLQRATAGVTRDPR